MSKLYLVILCSLALHASAQWTQVGTALTGSARSLYFTDENNGFAVGGNNSNLGYIARTSDGGVNWTSTSYSGTALLRSIFFYTADTGYTCGASGLVLKTTDGGDNWETLYTNSSQYFRAVRFVSSLVGLLGGAAGTILKTTDGGTNWTAISLGQTTSDIIQLQMIDASTGFAVASSSAFVSGYIYRTTDGGDTWEQVYSDATKGFLALTIINSSTIYVGGYGQTILKSTDGGDTWESVYSGYAGNSFRAAAYANESKVFLVDDGTGNLSNGSILSTEDAGANWTDTQFSGIVWLCVTFPTPYVGYASNTVGTIYKIELPCDSVPTPSSINGDVTFCSGATAVFSVDEISGAESYDWVLPEGSTITDGEGTNSITVEIGANSGTVSVTAASDCATSGASSLEIIVNLTPPVPVVTFDAGTLSSSAATGNQWYYNGDEIPGATDQDYTPTENGTYHVVVTDNGCSSTSEPYEVVGVGISNAGDVSFTIAPNPMNDFTQIQVNDARADRLLITDVQGRIVFNQKITASHAIQFAGHSLASGMYSVRILNNKNELIGQSKLIVE